MRVLHLVSTQNLFGIDPVILVLLTTLERRQVPSGLLCVADGECDNIPLLRAAKRAGIQAGAFFHPGSWSPRRDQELRRSIAHTDIDIVHTHDYRSTTIAARALRLEGVKRVSSLLGLEIDGFWTSVWSRRNAKALRTFDHVVATPTELAGRCGRKLAALLGEQLEILPASFDPREDPEELARRLIAAYERLRAASGALSAGEPFRERLIERQP